MIVIDYQDRTPIYEQIVERVQRLVIKGVLAPDTQLPSVRNLAMELSINPNTIQKAYAILEQQGFIYPIKGRGNFIAPNPDGGLKKKQQEFYEKLKDTVAYAIDLKIEQEDFVAQVQKYYEEAMHD